MATRIGAVALAAAALVVQAQARERSPLRLVRTIPLPQVSGRFDHSSVDLERQRLFVALRDGGAVAVIDLETGREIQRLSGFAEPQGVFYVPAVGKLFVTSLRDGTCKVVSGDSLKVSDSIQLSVGANVIGYDSRTRYLYIGHGGRQTGDSPAVKRDPGQIAVVDAPRGKQVANIQTDPERRPGAVVVDQSRLLLFAANTLGGEVLVIDRSRNAVLSRWKVPDVGRSGTLALDEARRRLFVGTRDPARVIVFDADSGRLITSFDTVDGIDRLHYDPEKRRVYATGAPKSAEGDGLIEAYRQLADDRYELIARIPTRPDGGKSLLVPQVGRLYVPLPPYKGKAAEIRVYDTRP